jgi:hypothetical protein
MKTILAIITTLALAVNLQAQALQPFKKLEVTGMATITLIQGTKNEITFNNPANTNAIINQNGDVVSVNASKEIDLTLTFTEIEDILISGAGDVKAQSPINATNLNLTVSGAGDLDLDVNALNIECLVSGGGDIRLKGKTITLKSTLSGAGDLYAYDLQSEKATLAVSGAGDAKINVSKEITASVSGAGSVLFKGDPQERNINIAGAGSVRQTDGNNENVEINVNINGLEKAIENDTTRITLGKKKIIIIEDENGNKEEQEVEIEIPEVPQFPDLSNKPKKHKVKTIYKGFEMGMNSYMAKPFDTFSPRNNQLEPEYGRSIQLNLNPFEYSLKLYKNYVALTTGLGFTFNRYMFDKNFSLVADVDTFGVVQDTISFRKNMLKASYLSIPLMLQFNTHHKNSKSFHFAFGIVQSLKLGSRTKQVWNVSNSKQKDIEKDNFNLNPFRTVATVRVGYGNFNLFAEYGLTTLFRNNRGPELYPFSVGITLIPF